MENFKVFYWQYLLGKSRPFRLFENNTVWKVSVFEVFLVRILRISPHSIRMQENGDPKNSEYGHSSSFVRKSFICVLQPRLPASLRWNHTSSRKKNTSQFWARITHIMWSISNLPVFERLSFSFCNWWF